MDSIVVRYGLIALTVLVVFVVAAFAVVQGRSASGTTVSMAGPNSIVSHLKADLAAGRHVTLTQDGDTVTLDDGHRYSASFDARLDVTGFLRNNGVNTQSRTFENHVEVTYVQPNPAGAWVQAALNVLPLVLFVLLFLYFMNRTRGSE